MVVGARTEGGGRGGGAVVVGARTEGGGGGGGTGWSWVHARKVEVEEEEQ